jgi:hypothetical protein
MDVDTLLELRKASLSNVRHRLALLAIELERTANAFPAGRIRGWLERVANDVDDRAADLDQILKLLD